MSGIYFRDSSRKRRSCLHLRKYTKDRLRIEYNIFIIRNNDRFNKI